MKIYCDENIESAIVEGLKIAYRWTQEGKEHKGILYAHPLNAHPLNLSVGDCIRMVELVTQVLTEEEMKNHIEFL